MPAFSVALLLFPTLMLGTLLPLSARSRRGIAFGVTLPLDLAESAVVRDAIRRYRVIVLSAASVLGLSILLFAALHHARAATALSTASVFLLLATSYVAWARERRQLLPHSITVPWTRSASLIPERKAPPIATGLAAVLPLALTAALLRAHWSSIPERWPQHWNAAMQVDGWGTRTATSVYLPLVLGLVVTLALVAILAFIAYAPAVQSRLRARIFAPMAAIAWGMSLLFCMIACLPLLHLKGPEPMIVLIVTHMIFVLAIVIWLVVRTGAIEVNTQTTPRTLEPYDGTPDAFWHAGLFYYNPGDPAVLVPKRMGFGWTFNLARPLTWLFGAALALFVLVSSALPFLTKHR